MGLLSFVPKIGGLLGNAFGGFDDPRLDPVQNAMARKQAMLSAGISMLGASGPSTQPVGLGQIIAQGLQTGQQVGGMGRQNALVMQQQQAQAAQKKQLADAIANGDITPDAVKRMAVQMAASGDSAGAAALVGLLKDMQPKDAPKGVLAKDNSILIDPTTGKVIADYGSAPKAPVFGTPEYFTALEQSEKIKAKYAKKSGGDGGSSGGRPTPYVDESGTTRLGVWNPRTRSYDPVSGAGPVTGGGSESQQKAAAFAQFIPDHIKTIESVVNAPTRLQQALSDRGIRELTNNEQQKLKIAGQAVTEAWLRMTTGSAYNDTEFKNAYNMFVPAPGDTKDVIDEKKANLQRLQSMLKGLAGRSLQQPTTPVGTVLNDPFAHLGRK